MVQMNGKWAANYIREIIIPDFDMFGKVVTKRLLPTFDTFGTEALEHGEKWFRGMAAGLDPFDNDQYEAAAYHADKAMDKTIAFADMLVAMYFTSVGVYSVGLFHLFEQHFADLPLRIHREINGYKNEFKREKIVKNWLKSNLSVDVETFTAWPVICELKLVANTIKHAEGKSATDLRSRCPDLFIHPAEREREDAHTMPIQSRVRKPLFGEDLYLTTDDFSRYVDGIISFWSELSTEMAKQ